jgi:ABC-type phosphate transport system substrate-binding protein
MSDRPGLAGRFFSLSNPLYRSRRTPSAVYKTLSRITILAGVVLLAASPYCQAFDVIVNRSVDLSRLERRQLKDIFSLRASSWPDGSAIKVFARRQSHPTHTEFVKRVLDFHPYQLHRIWDRQVYAGYAQAPEFVDSEIEMAERVGATPGAIGYVENGPYKAAKAIQIHD